MRRLFVYLSLITIFSTNSSLAQILPINQTCADIQKEIKAKNTLLTENLPDLDSAFESLINSLGGISILLNEKGINTAEFDRHILLLKAKSTKLKSDRNAYQEILKQARTYNCDLESTLLTEEIQKIKDAASSVKISLTDFSTYFNETIVKDLQEFKYAK